MTTAIKNPSYIELMQLSCSGDELPPEDYVEQLERFGVTVEQFEQDCELFEKRQLWLDQIVDAAKANREADELEAQRRRLLAEAQKLVDQAYELQLQARQLKTKMNRGEQAKRLLADKVNPWVSERHKALMAESREVCTEKTNIENRLERGTNDLSRQATEHEARRAAINIAELQRRFDELESRRVAISRELTALVELSQSVAWPQGA